MNHRITLLLIIALLTIASASAQYSGRALGDGCGGVDATIYDASCKLVCDAQGRVVEECTVVHGWCTSQDACVPCDFIDTTTVTIVETCVDKIEPAYTSCFNGVKTEVEFSYRCEEIARSAACFPESRTVIQSPLEGTQTCQEKEWGFDFDGDGSYDGNVPLDRKEVPPAEDIDCTPIQGVPNYCERKYWIDSAQSELDKNPDYFFTNGNTQYCEDADDDGFTNLCGDSNIGNVKPDHDTIFSQYECDDGTPMDEYWKDSDNDGRWDDLIRACNPPSGYTPLPANANTQTTNYDCNPSSQTTNFPEGCYCKTDQLGKSYSINGNTYSCMKTSGQTTLVASTLTSIELTRQITAQKWVQTLQQETGILGEVNCPEGFCGISESLPESSSNQCVPVGTLANMQGKVGEGDLVCEGTDEGTQWISRTNKLAGLLTQMGELSGKDYTLYCDSFDNIAHQYLENSGTASAPSPGSQEYIKQLTTSSNQVGNGCILILQEGDSQSYTKQIKEALRPAPFSQKVVFGFAVNTLPSQIYSLDLNDQAGSEEWTKSEGTYVSHPKKMVLILQSSKDIPQTDAELDNLFNQATTPNSFTYTLFRFLRSPLTSVLGILGISNTTPPLPELIDKVYLSKYQDFYWQSVVVNDNLYMKIANAPIELQSHLNQNICQKQTCLVDGNTLGITLPASEFSDWSRPLRLQEDRTNAGYNFFDATCEQDNQCNNPPGSCFEPVGMCSSVGFCEYSEVPIGNIDGCCPSGATEDSDVDCSTESTGSFACSDNADNDGDGLVDEDDPGCEDESDNNEQNLQPLAISVQANSCSGTELFYLNTNIPTQLNNVHANKLRETSNPIVCTNAGLDTMWVSGNACPVGYGDVITLLSPRNAQVSKANGQGTISGSQTLCAKNDNGPISCELKTSCPSSAIGLSAQTNAHVGTLYNSKLCCEYVEEGVSIVLNHLVTGSSATFTCTFEGGADPHEVIMDFGDATPQLIQQGINTQGTQNTRLYSHTYSSAGNYEATCTVRDGNLITKEATTQIIISE